MTLHRWAPTIALACVAVLHLVLLGIWGEPTLLHDEADYVQAGRDVAAWLRGEQGTSPEVLGRLALHNPGYALLFPLAEITVGNSPLFLRLLQVLAGLVAGGLLYRVLERRFPAPWALGGALLLWLHPSMIFFRLTLWPVALATLGTTALAWAILELLDHPEDTGRQWTVGAVLAPLPFLSASALLLIPALALGLGLRRAPRTVAPALLLWIPWTLLLSLQLGMFAPVDLSGPRNLALGNHPAISEGRGSLWGDPKQKAVFLGELERACGSEASARDVFRCKAQASRAIAWATAARDPGASAARALRRVGETWQADRFLPRHIEALHGSIPALLDPLLLLLHLVLLLAAAAGLRSPRGRAALLGVLLWSLPVLLSVGFTRLRQPILPWLILAAAYGWSVARRQPGQGTTLRTTPQ